MNPEVIIGSILLLAFGVSCLLAWLVKRFHDRANLDAEPLPVVVSAVAGRIDPDQPRRRANEWTRIRLSTIQRLEILDRYDDEVLDSKFRPHLQLEVFADMVKNTPPGKSIPMFTAQQEPVLRFAHDHRLPWLTELLMDHVAEEAS